MRLGGATLAALIALGCSSDHRIGEDNPGLGGNQGGTAGTGAATGSGGGAGTTASGGTTGTSEMSAVLMLPLGSGRDD